MVSTSGICSRVCSVLSTHNELQKHLDKAPRCPANDHNSRMRDLRPHNGHTHRSTLAGMRHMWRHALLTLQPAHGSRRVAPIVRGCGAVDGVAGCTVLVGADLGAGCLTSYSRRGTTTPSKPVIQNAL